MCFYGITCRILLIEFAAWFTTFEWYRRLGVRAFRAGWHHVGRRCEQEANKRSALDPRRVLRRPRAQTPWGKSLTPGAPPLLLAELCLVRQNTVSFHNFKSWNFKLSVSNPKSKYVAYLSVLSQISNCQSLVHKNKHEIMKTDRNNHFNNLHFILSLEANKFDYMLQTRNNCFLVNCWNVGRWNDSKTRTQKKYPS